MVIWNHGELPPEMGEEFEEEGPEENLECRITIEVEQGLRPEKLIIDEIPDYVPMDGYLQKELEKQDQERQEQETLSKMLPKRIP